jgi:hypothetical protein
MLARFTVTISREKIKRKRQTRAFLILEVDLAGTSKTMCELSQSVPEARNTIGVQFEMEKLEYVGQSL